MAEDKNGREIHVTDRVRMPDGTMGTVITVEEGFDDGIDIQPDEGYVTSREPGSLEVVDD